jgi:hypothetical protein
MRFVSEIYMPINTSFELNRRAACIVPHEEENENSSTSDKPDKLSTKSSRHSITFTKSKDTAFKPDAYHSSRFHSVRAFSHGRAFFL